MKAFCSVLAILSSIYLSLINIPKKCSSILNFSWKDTTFSPLLVCKERYLNFEELNFEGLSAPMSNKQDLKIYLNYKVIDYSLAKTGHPSILSHGCWQLKSLFLRLAEETSGSRDKWHTILSPVSECRVRTDMTIVTQSPSHLASPSPGPESQAPVIRARVPVTHRSRSQPSLSRPSAEAIVRSGDFTRLLLDNYGLCCCIKNL